MNLVVVLANAFAAALNAAMYASSGDPINLGAALFSVLVTLYFIVRPVA